MYVLFIKTEAVNTETKVLIAAYKVKLMSSNEVVTHDHVILYKNMFTEK